MLAGIFGLAFGLLYFWPAAVLLILASHAAQSDGRLPRLLATSGALLGVIAVAGWSAAIHETALRPSDAYLTFQTASAADCAADADSLTGNTGFSTTAVRRTDRV